MNGLVPLVPVQFRWRRYDSPDEEWSAWHSYLPGYCAACCCPPGGQRYGGEFVLCECGARQHQEAAEPVTFWDTDHIGLCQGCDLADRDQPVEIRYALPLQTDDQEGPPWDSRSSNSPTGGSPSSTPLSTSSSSSTPPRKS